MEWIIGCRFMPRFSDVPRDKIKIVNLCIKLCKVLIVRYVVQLSKLQI